jgi:hypothetical protein
MMHKDVSGSQAVSFKPAIFYAHFKPKKAIFSDKNQRFIVRTAFSIARPETLRRLEEKVNADERT